MHGGSGREEGPSCPNRRFHESGFVSWDVDVLEGEIHMEEGTGTAEDARRFKATSGGTSKFVGVSKKKQSGKWQSKISFMGKQLHLGVFDEEIVAAKAYDRAALSLRLRRSGPPLPLGSLKLNFGLDSYSSKERRKLELMTPAELLMLLAGENRAARQKSLGIQRCTVRPGTAKQELTCRSAGSQAFGKTSRFRGVSFHRQRRKWQANICVQGRQTFLGIFASEENAAHAYDYGAICIHAQDDGRMDIRDADVQLRYATILNFPLIDYESLIPIICEGGLCELVAALRKGRLPIPPTKPVPQASTGEVKTPPSAHTNPTQINQNMDPWYFLDIEQGKDTRLSGGASAVLSESRELIRRAFAAGLEEHRQLPEIQHPSVALEVLPLVWESSMPFGEGADKTPVESPQIRWEQSAMDVFPYKSSTPVLQPLAMAHGCRRDSTSAIGPDSSASFEDDKSWLSLLPSPTGKSTNLEEGELNIADILLL